MEDLLILVDENDNEIDYMDKTPAHVEERLHRAFSVFIYNWHDQKMLIHKRAEGKYHSGGLWTNACCSHPRKGEETREATIRRMKQELGLSFTAEEVDEAHLQELGSFLYYKKFDSCAEHEIDHVFYLSIDKESLEFDLDPEEIAEIKWIGIPELKEWLAKEPESFSAWFPTGFKMVCEKIC